jgi:branched-chain amino acid transport system ATP-binding protein
MSNDALLEVNHIDAFHGTFQALWDVSLTIRPGEIVAIVGANGAGKSTLLDTISGLLHPSRGNILFDGKSISLLEPYEVVNLGISQTPEGRRVFPDMTVLENLLIGSYNRRARSTWKQSLQRAYELFPRLEQRKSQQAKTMSGGEQQMLAIGRSLMSNPRLIVLDEMSLGLAPLIVDELYHALTSIRQRGITILFVEQNVRRSLLEADKAYIMESGRVVLSGDASTLREEERVKKAYFGTEVDDGEST